MGSVPTTKKRRKVLPKEQAIVRADQQLPSASPVMQKSAKDFASLVAREIVKNLSSLRLKPFSRESTLASISRHLDAFVYIVDTSICVDGRIVSLVESGVLTGTLIIPQFVLGELQHIADSNDSLRRAKGRRGLEVVNALVQQKKNPWVVSKVETIEITEQKEVDAKLVVLAKTRQARLLTVDFNLAQVARAEQVFVITLTDVATALQSPLVSGELVQVKITHKGKERQQGVGYLSDGTMVVVEDAKEKVGEELLVTITKVHQTPAGQLFFGKIGSNS